RAAEAVVVAVARDDQVARGAADDRVGTGTGRDPVGAALAGLADREQVEPAVEPDDAAVVAEYDVVPAGGDDRVRAVVPRDHVVAGAGRDGVVVAGRVGRG